MSIEKIVFRKATIKDTSEIFRLYKLQAKIPGTLNRDEIEISKKYVEEFTLRALKNSSQFVAVDTFRNNLIVGEVHCYKLEPKSYNHALSELSIVIHPEYQGKGLGKRIFEVFLNNIIQNRADILRVELVVKESNVRAIKFFESFGFIIEGRLERRIRSINNKFEAEIPMAWFNPKYRRSE